MIDVHDTWGIEGKMTPITGSTWSVGRDYVLKKATKSALANNISFLHTLGACNVPVAKPVPGKNGEALVMGNDGYYLLTKRLMGTHITNIYQQEYKTLAYETGKTVARLHKAFRECEKLTLPDERLFIEELEGWIYSALEKEGWTSVPEDDYLGVVSALKDCYSLLPKQLIHRDLHYGNMLFDDMIFTGYIDFDLSKRDVRIFDLCYFLLGLLIDHNNKADIPIWLEIVHSFIEGYEDLEPLESAEKAVVPFLMQGIELLFVVYFHKNENNELKQGAVDLYKTVSEYKEAICAAL